MKPWFSGFSRNFAHLKENLIFGLVFDVMRFFMFDHFFTILGNFDFRILPILYHFLIFNDFLTILGIFDFRIFPILCDFMSILRFLMTFCQFTEILILGFFPFYVNFTIFNNFLTPRWSQSDLQV